MTVAAELDDGSYLFRCPTLNDLEGQFRYYYSRRLTFSEEEIDVLDPDRLVSVIHTFPIDSKRTDRPRPPDADPAEPVLQMIDTRVCFLRVRPVSNGLVIRVPPVDSLISAYRTAFERQNPDIETILPE